MLEVGRVNEPSPGTFTSWNRAHFGAWCAAPARRPARRARPCPSTFCAPRFAPSRPPPARCRLPHLARSPPARCITSAPLILGLELTDAKLEPILDIIGNAEAIAINQAGLLTRAPTPLPPLLPTYAQPQPPTLRPTLLPALPLLPISPDRPSLTRRLLRRGRGTRGCWSRRSTRRPSLSTPPAPRCPHRRRPTSVSRAARASRTRTPTTARAARRCAAAGRAASRGSPSARGSWGAATPSTASRCPSATRQATRHARPPPRALNDQTAACTPLNIALARRVGTARARGEQEGELGARAPHRRSDGQGGAPYSSTLPLPPA